MRGGAVTSPSGTKVLWVSTSRHTRGGIASYVNTVAATPLWSTWNIEHISTHADGSAAWRIREFVVGLARIARALLGDQIDLVHVHTSSKGSFIRKAIVVWLVNSRRVPVVLHVHGSGLLDFRRRRSRLGRLTIDRTLRRADIVIGLGDRLAASLSDVIPGLRVVAVPNVVTIPPDAAPRTRPSSDGAQSTRVLYAGRISPDKGAFTLIDAWHGLPDMGDARLIVIGDRGTDEARRTVERLGLSESVDILPWQPAATVNRLMSEAVVFVLPSRMEGQSMSLLEAMSHGCAVVATATGGTPDLVTDGETGLLVPPDDPTSLTEALHRVLTDDALRTRLAAAGLERVRREHNAAREWQRLDEIYRDVTGVSPSHQVVEH